MMKKENEMTNSTDVMTRKPVSWFSRILSGMFPRMPDFYRLLNDQCSLVVGAMDVFVAFMETGDVVKAKEVSRLEREGDKLKTRNIDVLNLSFSTPFDREDIYRAITTIYEGLDYAKTTVQEMEVLGVEPDKHMIELARLLCQGAKALQSGFEKVKDNPSEAERDATAVRMTERQAKNVYRQAIAELFNPEHYAQDLAMQRKKPRDDLAPLLEPMDQKDCTAVVRGLSFVMEAMKRREVYRHLSNASDHMAHAGDILHDIVVKSA